MPLLTEEQAYPRLTVPLYGRKGLLTTDPGVLIYLVGGKVEFGANNLELELDNLADVLLIFPWVLANSRDQSYMVAIEECRKDSDLRIEVLYRKTGKCGKVSLSPGSVVTLSYADGVERIENPDGTTVKE